MSTDVGTGARSRAGYGQVWRQRGRLTLVLWCRCMWRPRAQADSVCCQGGESPLPSRYSSKTNFGIGRVQRPIGKVNNGSSLLPAPVSRAITITTNNKPGKYARRGNNVIAIKHIREYAVEKETCQPEDITSCAISMHPDPEHHALPTALVCAHYEKETWKF
ncbi:hypothetical protein BDW02DRAFT_582486 [Decorospora gaudefroyi]|uniref:Uncharacterized protein n=1 Tax=Decorospora gaudefroyi TaxID=184978 RepID=A0A6A5KC28_9PLEO|nr:hypothetical protein BDW02DRAFT_582486 [Decorospora gaudefroyi]